VLKIVSITSPIVVFLKPFMLIELGSIVRAVELEHLELHQTFKLTVIAAVIVTFQMTPFS